MPGIKFTSFYNRAQNPSVNFLPYNAGGSFADSPLSATEEFLFTQTTSGNVIGFDFDINNRTYALGDKNYFIEIGAGITGISFHGAGIQAGSAGGFATHLIINVNGNDRKIKLLNP